ncbi:ATP-binding protein [Vibrio alfacsensis]|uniref:ATP-binding protein n=1 Tax=Vibrio alfacsensis TaxID=1074311 RepID=UPI002ADDD6E8|nr:ATP-binding protein [Vibrio alfacsensis]WQE77447.1 ATP-binding protein [Vibrio alfacsensis]
MTNEYLSANTALLRKIEREIASRKQAEALLEQKSLALFEANQKLELAVTQLEKSSAENLIKLEFQQQVDALLIHFGRVFLRKNLDDIILDNFTQKLTENTLIEQCRLVVLQHHDLGLANQQYGQLNANVDLKDGEWLNGELQLPLTIHNERYGSLRILVRNQDIDQAFIKRSIVLVTELLCGAISRQHTIYRNIESRKIAEQSERSTRDFLAMINHELRTPLNGLLGTSELLSETALNHQQTMLVNNLSQSGELLRTIINDLLDFSKINSGMFELIPSQFEVKSLVSTLESIFEHKAQEKGLLFDISAKDNLPNAIDGDLERITQVFVNLIGNAIKFTDKGSVLVTLDWENEQLSFSVQDTGIGINENSQEKLFQPFTQVDRSSKRAYEGTGLGLAICQQLIQLMGGQLSLQSQEGIGTQFYGTIPLKSVGEDCLHLIDTPKKMIHISSELAILVVDDILLNQVIIKEMLNKLGIVADIAANGIEALTSAEKRNYDLIFMDCRMPEMDGFEATVALRDLKFNNPIIALTAGTTLEERKKCIECGMNDILTKPYTSEDLKSVLLKWTS